MEKIMPKGIPPLPSDIVKTYATDEGAIEYLEQKYGKVGKVFFDWRQGLTKNETNEPYVNMRALDQLIKNHQDGHLEKEPKVIGFMLNIKEEDLNTLLVNLKQFEQTNSVLDKMQKIRDSQVSPTDSSKNKPSN